MAKQLTIELRPDDQDLQRMISELGSVRAPGNPYLGRTESEIAYQLLTEAAEDSLRRMTAAVAANSRANAAALVEPNQAQPISPGSYTSDTLPPLGARAQALLDSIWEGAEKDAKARPAKEARRGRKSRKPRGRLRLTDHGGESVIEYLAKR